MGVPSFLDTDFAVAEVVGMTDWNTGIAAVNTLLTATLPAASRWTDLGSNEFRCPAQDPSGANRFFNITLTRTSATRLTFAVKDKSGTTFHTGTIDHTGTATVRIYAGPYHLVIDALSGGAYETAYAFMVDPTPFGLNQTDVYTFAWTRRNSAGTAYSTANQFGISALVANDIGGTTPRTRACIWYSDGGGTNDPKGYTCTGSILAMPYEVGSGLGVVANVRWAGRGYQMIVLPENLAFGTVVTVPIDDGVTGDFQVVGLLSPSFGDGTLGVRVA